MEKHPPMSCGTRFRQFLRNAHRELSYVFAGALLVYAISGIALNHKATYNSQYTIQRTELALTPSTQLTSEVIDQWLLSCGMEGREIQHYMPDSTTAKIFLKSNSSLVVDMTTGKAVLEQVKKRPIMGALSKLHYNPGKAWTWFSDIFSVAMVILVITGIFMLKGKHSLWGIGGIEFLIGILIPLLFMVL